MEIRILPHIRTASTNLCAGLHVIYLRIYMSTYSFAWRNIKLYSFCQHTYVCDIAQLKGGGYAKNFFLILVSNGQLNGEIMKYAFLKFLFLNYTIK